MIKSIVFLAATVLLAAHFAHADTPASCLAKQMYGDWTFSIGPTTSYAPDCSQPFKVVKQIKVTLHEPDIATAGSDVGFWTMIYNQGYELVIGGQKFFAFADWTGSGKNVTSHCDRTKPGLVHNDVSFNPTEWACYTAQLTSAENADVARESTVEHKTLPDNALYQSESSMANLINAVGGTWQAAAYDDLFVGMKLSDVQRMRGVRASEFPREQMRAKLAEPKKPSPMALPDSFDWRNVDGVDYVPAVRNQLQCGSCYTFGSTGAMMARIRVNTGNKQQPQLSPQYLVSCSNYSQGCDGGFAYLTSKWGEDFGIVEESCFPYNGTDLPCSQMCDNPKRWYFTNYRYVGGFYGAGNEEVMMRELVEGGPIAVGFEVHHDFMHYKSGVYQYTGMDRFAVNDGLILTNHAVMVVGYGSTPEGVDYWIVQNSWSAKWGEDGYFKILRGSTQPGGECGIESMPCAMDPILS